MTHSVAQPVAILDQGISHLKVEHEILILVDDCHHAEIYQFILGASLIKQSSMVHGHTPLRIPKTAGTMRPLLLLEPLVTVNNIMS